MKEIIGTVCLAVGTMILVGAISVVVAAGFGMFLIPVCLSALLLTAGAMLFDD